MEKVKNDNFMLYLKYILFISVLNLLVRLTSAIGLSKLWGVEFTVQKFLDVIPVLGYSESNVLLFKQISTISLIMPAVVIFIGFLYTILKKNFKNLEVREVAINSWYVGVFLSLLQYSFALFLDERIQFVNDWRGLLVVLALVVVATWLYFSKKNK